MERAAPMFDNINGLNLKETELTLGLPGRDQDEQQQQQCSSSSSNTTISDHVTNNNKRSSSELTDEHQQHNGAPKAQVVGWPPVRCYRRNVLAKPESDSGSETMFVKVSMDGAPYLRKIDLKSYNNYFDLLKALENMFDYINGCEYAAITYEDKDGDWMLAGDVPWDMFLTSCKRLRIIPKDRPRA